MSARLYSERENLVHLFSMREMQEKDSQETTASLPLPQTLPNEDGGGISNEGPVRKTPRLLVDTEVTGLCTQEQCAGEAKESRKEEQEGKSRSPDEVTTEEEKEEEEGKPAEAKEDDGTPVDDALDAPSFVSCMGMEPLYHQVSREDCRKWKNDIPCMIRVPAIARDDLEVENGADRLVVIFLDASSSMVTKDVVATVVELLRQLVKLGDKATVAVMAYNCGVHMLLTPRPAGSLGDADILDVLRLYKAAVAPGTNILKALYFFDTNAEAWRSAMLERKGCLMIETELIVLTDGEDTGRMGTHLTQGGTSRDQGCMQVCQSLRRPRTTFHVIGLGTPETLDLPVLRGLHELSLAKGTFYVVRPQELALVPCRVVDHLCNRGPLVEVTVMEVLCGSGRNLFEEREDQKLHMWSSFLDAVKVPFSATPGHHVRLDFRIHVVRPEYNGVRLWRAKSYYPEVIRLLSGDAAEQGQTKCSSRGVNHEVAMLFQTKYIEEVYLRAKMEEFLSVVRGGRNYSPENDTPKEPAFLGRLRTLLGTVADTCTRFYGESRVCKEALDAFVDLEAVRLVDDRFYRHAAAEADGPNHHHHYYSDEMWQALEKDFVHVMYQSQNSLDFIEDEEQTQSQLERIHSSQRELLGDMVAELEEGRKGGAAAASGEDGAAATVTPARSPQYQVEEGSIDLTTDEVLTRDADEDFQCGGGAATVAAAPRSQPYTDVMTGETEVGDRPV